MFKQKVKEAKWKFYDEALQNMANSNKPWEAIQWTRARRPPLLACIKNCQNSPIQSLNELWETLHLQYCKTMVSDIDDSIVHDILSRHKHMSYTISKTEIKDALALCSNISTLGPDRLTWYHLKHLINDDLFLEHITNLYNDILNTGIWLSTFKESYSVIIPKPNKPHHDTAKMYWPIALLNTLSKLFTKVLTKRINQECVEFELLYKGQCGGVEEHSMLDVSQSRSTLVSTLVRTRSPLLILIFWT
ncbi:hypothetical protein AX17_006379 [Amanita inopinata Kibby_2008]|nr:hypothetical protein AX17_006379 [Amanita inopinata Kibby_2008]